MLKYKSVLKKTPIIIIYSVSYIFFPTAEAFADAGLPMISLIMPVSAVAIFPVIIIESIYLKNRLGLPWKETGKATIISNLFSSFVGVPLTWVLLLIIQSVTGGSVAWGVKSMWGKILSVTWQAPWLIPYEQQSYWMIPGAGIFLLVPFFFVSWWAELLVIQKIFKERIPTRTKQIVRNMNLLSYGLLFLWLLFLLIRAIANRT